MGLTSYHVHTPRCGHATGEPFEYVEEALELGFTEIGFADHAPIPLPRREGITMEPGETEDYISDLQAVKEKYQGKIAVKIGFEVDYPLEVTFPRRYFMDSRLDFLIGSCHFLGSWPFDHGDYMDEFEKRDMNEVYYRYYSIIHSMVESRLFQVIGHLDLMKKFGYRPQNEPVDLLERIARRAGELGISVEMNTAGMIKPVEEIYPSDSILQILYNHNVPVTLSSDAHAPEQVGQYFDLAVNKLKKTGYKKISGFHKRKRYDIPL
jgi:histidinol-phosphatase (PHP family)